MTDSKSNDMVTVKVLQPIAQLTGPCLTFGMKAEFPKADAERLIAQKTVELWTGVDLVEAIKAVQDAGAEISFNDDNVAMIQAYERIEGEAKPAGDSLAEKTNAELREMAEANGIDVPKNANKAALLELLK